jgi:VanZ family protein
MGPGLPIPHLDKAAHFSYFFAGGFLFAGCHLRLLQERPDWRKIITAAIIGMAVIGWLDEWHQTFTAGRQGGDLWDWLADVLGGTTGAVVLKSAHRRIK